MSSLQNQGMASSDVIKYIEEIGNSYNRKKNHFVQILVNYLTQALIVDIT